MLVATGDAAAAAASDQTSFTKLTDHPLNQHQKRNTINHKLLNSTEIVLHALTSVWSSIPYMLES